jgi:hypothetical protein
MTKPPYINAKRLKPTTGLLLAPIFPSKRNSAIAQALCLNIVSLGRQITNALASMAELKGVAPSLGYPRQIRRLQRTPTFATS